MTVQRDVPRSIDSFFQMVIMIRAIEQRCLPHHPKGPFKTRTMQRNNLLPILRRDYCLMCNQTPVHRVYSATPIALRDKTGSHSPLALFQLYKQFFLLAAILYESHVYFQTWHGICNILSGLTFLQLKKKNQLIFCSVLFTTLKMHKKDLEKFRHNSTLIPS